jgi:hypothetical protein
MPAVQLTQLQSQINQLSWLYTRPPEYIAGLRVLFEQYANLVFKKGQITRKLRHYPTYNIPPVLLNQLELSLIGNHKRYPQASLPLVDALWQEKYYEPKYLASALLGRIDPGEAAPVLERVIKWCQPDLHPVVSDAILDRATLTLRYQYAPVWISQLETWLNPLNQSLHTVGLRAMLPLIKDRQFDNLPPVFRLLSPFIENPRADHQPLLADLLIALFHRTPIETTYLLRQMSQRGLSPTAQRLIRRVLPVFPPSEQEQLRLLLKDSSPTDPQ